MISLTILKTKSHLLFMITKHQFSFKRRLIIPITVENEPKEVRSRSNVKNSTYVLGQATISDFAKYHRGISQEKKIAKQPTRNEINRSNRVKKSKAIHTCDYKRSDDGNERYIHERALEAISLQVVLHAVAPRASKPRRQRQRHRHVPDGHEHGSRRNEQRGHHRQHEERRSEAPPDLLEIPLSPGGHGRSSRRNNT